MKKTPVRPPWDYQDHHGPFDLIGDVHGCADELEDLLQTLGYKIIENRPGALLSSGPIYVHPEDRQAVFLGDFVDRGPGILKTLRILHNMVEHGSALCVIGNHDDKLLRKLKGRNVEIKNGLETSVKALETLPDDVQKPFKHQLTDFLNKMFYYLVLDQGRLIAVHAGIKKDMIGRASDQIKAFALYGDTTGQQDDYGLPIRRDWAADYHGSAWIIYGHSPVTELLWKNKTLNIDTGCVFGGTLTALQYPEMETVSIPARKIYYQSQKPFLTTRATDYSI